MARSSFSFKPAALSLLGSSLVLTLVGSTPSPRPVPDVWKEPATEGPPAAGVPHPDILGVGRLAAFAASAAQPMATPRNPFARSQERSEPEAANGSQPARPRPVAPAPSAAPTDVAVAPPALIGIVLETPGGPARTGVFMTPDGGLEFAETGQTVGGERYRISDVTAAGAVLVNLKTGATARLSLQ